MINLYIPDFKDYDPMKEVELTYDKAGNIKNASLNHPTLKIRLSVAVIEN